LKHAVSAAKHTTESFSKIPNMIEAVLNLQSRFLMWVEHGYFGKESTHECRFHKDSQPQGLSVPNTNSLFFYGIKNTCVHAHAQCIILPSHVQVGNSVYQMTVINFITTILMHLSVNGTHIQNGT
jgi:hypothetical protein